MNGADEQMPAIYEVFGTDAHAMTYSLMSAADVASMIPRGANIALKPNLVIAAGPEGGATTHPGVLSAALPIFRITASQRSV